MFAGPDTRDQVVNSLNGIGNVMNLRMEPHEAYDKLLWGIQTIEQDNGEVRLEQHIVRVADLSIR